MLLTLSLKQPPPSTSESRGPCVSRSWRRTWGRQVRPIPCVYAGPRILEPKVVHLMRYLKRYLRIPEISYIYIEVSQLSDRFQIWGDIFPNISRYLRLIEIYFDLFSDIVLDICLNCTYIEISWNISSCIYNVVRYLVTYFEISFNIFHPNPIKMFWDI